MVTKHKIVIGNCRDMSEVEDNTVHLMVTSPPYPMIEMWDQLFEDVGCKTYEQMHNYLAQVWNEVYRVLVDGGIACINIGDATRKVNGTFRLFPNHSKVIEHCEKIGFITLPNILWKKPTTKPKYKGKGAFLGSGMLPPNAYVTLDCEYILIFRKGNLRKFKPKDEIRYASAYTKEERDVWFSQIWDVVGTKQNNTEVGRRVAAFPKEIPCRLIKMFSIIGDTVLDPFLGTGTTAKVAKELNRNSIGYEIKADLLEIIKEKIGVEQKSLSEEVEFEIVEKRG